MLGTVVTVGGAMLMSLTKGPALNLPWARPGNQHHSRSETIGNKQDFVMGSLMITEVCFCWSCFMILQVSLPKINVIQGCLYRTKLINIIFLINELVTS